MRRYELGDARWDQIKDLMTKSEGSERPWENHRLVLNGMMWILHTGAQWRDLPDTGRMAERKPRTRRNVVSPLSAGGAGEVQV